MRAIFVFFVMLMPVHASANSYICEEALEAFQDQIVQLDRQVERLQWAAENRAPAAIPDCDAFESLSSQTFRQLIALRALDASFCDLGEGYLDRAERKLNQMNARASSSCSVIRRSR